MFVHVPVLLNETIEGLNIHKDGIYVDGTLGRGGHSSEILRRLDQGFLYSFDQDDQAIIESKDRLTAISSRFAILHDTFAHLQKRLQTCGVEKIDGAMFDLGVSSAQFDDGERGFSYRFDAKLDMRMNRLMPLTAYEVVNTYSMQDLAKIFKEYGEEPFAYPIAKAIVKKRMVKPIETTFQLVDIIKEVLPKKILFKAGHPAKQIFQAIRIEVNDELGALKRGLAQALEMLKPGGRIAVITFHSLEDRIVKTMFKEKVDCGEGSRRVPTLQKVAAYRLVYRKALVATAEEVAVNPRSKSAKLRLIERTCTHEK